MGALLVPTLAGNIARVVKADVTAATAWTTGNSPITLFTVTGVVKCNVWGVVTSTLTSTGGTGTLSVGISGSVTAFLPTTTVNGTNINLANTVWVANNSTTATAVELNSGAWNLISNANIILTIATNNMAGGGMTIYCQWIPMSPGASVV